jgi:tetratricopeptide (TPR) repeat protein
MSWLLILATGIIGAGLAWAEYQRGQRHARAFVAMRDAMEQRDWPAVVDRCRELLKTIRQRGQAQRVRMVLAHAIGRSGQHDVALQELRAVEEGLLYAIERASLHNAMAYHMALAGQIAEAFVEVKQAEAHLAALHLPAQVRTGPSGNAKTIAASVRGTRGIVHFLDGNLDQAELDLQSALEMQPDDKQRAALDAERWWWLSEISRKRGRDDEARLRLENAAVHFKTEFGSRAAVALGRPPAH